MHSTRNTQNRLFHGILLMLCAILLAACKQDLPEEQRWQGSVTRALVDDHQTLRRLAQKQHEQAESFCSAPSEAGLQKLQNRWRDTMTAWQHLQWVRFGPVITDNDHWKLQFWPDKKNLVQRKVQELLRSEAPMTPETLEKASVVAQGLSAQELLLFDSQFAQVEKFPGRQCDLLRVSTQRVANVSERLTRNWQDKEWLAEWFHPAPRPGVSVAQVRNGEILDALLAQVEIIKNDKLGEPMGLKTRDKTPNGYFAESWRSQHSLANIQQNLKAVQQTVSPAKGYGLFLYLKDQQHSEVAEELIILLDNLHLALQQIQGPLSEAVTDPQQQESLNAAHRSAGALASFLKQKVAPALNVTLGFNSNDGD